MVKLNIEQRVARLEKLLKSNKPIKNESALRRDMHRDLAEIFDDRFCGDDYFGSYKNFKENMLAASQGDNDKLVDDAIMWLVDDYGYDEELLDDLRNEIADDLAEMADDLLHDWDGDDDDDWDDDYLESRKRRCENKKSALRKSVKNEDVKRLPNGDIANRVSDVLSGWADSSPSRPAEAIRELDRKGILKAATNKWYPTVDDVAEAVEDCWYDQIGMFGAGAAQFFIGNIGGVTKCSLTLYPVTGGTSRARNLVLKFDWPE